MRIKYKTFEMSDDNSQINLTIENNMVKEVSLTQPLSIKDFFQAVNNLQTEIQQQNINFIEKTKNEVKNILPVDMSVLAESIQTPEIASVVSSIVNDMNNQTYLLSNPPKNTSQPVDQSELRALTNFYQPVDQSSWWKEDLERSKQTQHYINVKNPFFVEQEIDDTNTAYLDRETEFLQDNNTSSSIEKKVEIATQPVEEKKIVRINNHDVEYTGKNYTHVADTNVNPQYINALSTNELLLGKMGY